MDWDRESSRFTLLASIDRLACPVYICPMRPHSAFVAVLALSASYFFAPGARGGQTSLGPQDNLRHEFAPYNLAKLNYLGLNYCENLLDERVNLTSYTHLGYDANNQDAWQLQFPDDTARLLEGLAWEDEYSPVVRLEFARRIIKGILAAHIPGTKDYYSFRNRIGGKTFLILDAGAARQGRVTLSNWGDSIEGCLKIGFRVRSKGLWHGGDAFAYVDEPEGAGSPAVARSERYWHESPFVFRRCFTGQGVDVDFTGRYWLSDEDKPLEYAFSTSSGDTLQIVLGEPGKPMPLLGDPASPTFIHLPDRTALRVGSETGDKTFEQPGFNYFLLRRATAWACPGYSSVLLVMWEHRPDRIEVLSTNGCGEIQLSFSPRNGPAEGRVWLYPFSWVNDKDMGYIFRSAEHFLGSGTLRQNGYPSQQLVNAIPAGLAAGACLLARYNDPFAATAAIRAEGAVDSVVGPLAEGKSFIRAFFPVRAAAWMIRLGHLKSDTRLIEKYTPELERWMKIMNGPTLGYDGKGWASGWEHFNCLKSAWLAYAATGNAAYREIYERALTVYTIDAKGIYRYGERLQAPGGFETYAGALALAAWGHAGKLDYVDKLINLAVPNGWQSPTVPLKDLWNDAGAGPWAQDDANPEYVGFCLRGLNLPRDEKWVLPAGAFPAYDRSEPVSVTKRPVLQNPYFRPGHDPLLVLPRDASKLARRTFTNEIIPGSRKEKACLQSSSGELEGAGWTCAGNQQLVYKFDLRRAQGAALDFSLKGDGYRIEVSPDAKRWLKSYESWSDISEEKSLDASFLTGNPDELIKLVTIIPPADERFLVNREGSQVQRWHSRYLTAGGSIVYALDLQGVKECHLDLLAGNGYRLECSPDRKAWNEVIAAKAVDSKRMPDAGWLWPADVTEFLAKDGKLYARFSDTRDSGLYQGHNAFLRRLTVYGTLQSDSVWVRLSNVAPTGRFDLQRITCRTWRLN